MRDLGVLINTNLTWGTHCRGLNNKCNRTMGMIKRAVGFNAPVACHYLSVPYSGTE